MKKLLDFNCLTMILHNHLLATLRSPSLSYYNTNLHWAMGSLGKLRLTRMDFAKALFESWPLSPIANCLTRRVGSIWNFNSSAFERIKRTVVEAFSYNRDNETLDVNSGDHPQF